MMLMGILDRYIARVVLGGTLIALLVVLALDVFFSFIGEVGDIGRGNYHALDALAYITLTIPRRIHELFPMAALLGSLMGLGMLASNSELVAMRAAGFSVRRVIASVLQVGILMLAVTTLVGEFVAPEADRQGQALREQALHDRTTFQSRHGYWIRDENRFIHIRRMDDPADLQDVFVYELDADHHLESATRIARARHQEGIWELSRVRTSRFEPASVQVSREQQAQRAQLMMPGVLDVVVLEPESMSVRELRRYIEYLASNGLEAERHQLALWLRLSAPLAGLVMLFLAVPFVFGSLRNVGAGQRLLVGVMVGIGFQLLVQILSHTGQVYGIHPVVSAFAPILLFLSGGVWALRRL
ncbi:MAG: LPS export ABC transporter permease LptG [Gammaproteobacteria bacterium]|nr:LPS export ABC transporter permease LptG [Gammaproteobacteria bacterium]